VKTSKRRFDSSSPIEWELESALLNSNPHRSISGASGFLKRSIDVVLSSAALILLAPVCAIIALAVRLSDKGAVFYRQTRIGLGGQPFTIIKFRTMREDAERDLGAVWSVPHDPRCTRAGYYLRRSGLDELPQLWNILRGEMSLVGPRPERPEFTQEFRKQYDNYDLRHVVRPGLTGYAQVHGWRGLTSLEERLRHDFYYIDNWSVVLDLRILCRTILRGFSERTDSGV
jgi:exopolysaccharide biosynthesis polyprenyl glycosylphosphotransferase